MANAPEQFANSIIEIGSTVVAKVTSVKRNTTMQEVEVTGAEDVSGALVDEQFVPVSIGTVLDLEGITVSGDGESTPAELEPGQSALRTAAEAGTEVVLTVTKPTGAAASAGAEAAYTGYLTGYSDGGAVKDVYKWTASLRVNSIAYTAPVAS